MRLTCPNCGAEYEVPEGMIPPGGKHVQCTNCHTRWFMRGVARQTLSEDQILRRLEARDGPRPLSVVPIGLAVVPPTVPDSPPTAVETAAPAPKDFIWESPEEAPEAVEDTPAAVVDIPQAEANPLPMRPAMVEPLRPAPRLELTAGPAGPPPQPVAPSRFFRGLLIAIVIVAVAAAIYVWRAPLSGSLPVAAPALDAYGATVDSAREWLDQLLPR